MTVLVEGADARGEVFWELRDADGKIKAQGHSQNVITNVGDQMYGERGAGIGSVTAPVGMKLGTGSTAAAKSGAGSFLTTYLADSHQSFASTPVSGLTAGKRRITYTATWAAGKANTNNPITEAVIVNGTLSDATSPEAATISRVLIANIPSKTVADTLTITWVHDIGS